MIPRVQVESFPPEVSRKLALGIAVAWAGQRLKYARRGPIRKPRSRSGWRGLPPPGGLELAPVTGLSLVGCRSGPATGLYGVVRRGPTVPVCHVGVPCSAPVANANLIFSADDQDIARTRSASDGSYRVELAPGVYSVRADPAIGFPKRGPRPSLVHVTDEGVTHIDFWFDTGIR